MLHIYTNIRLPSLTDQLKILACVIKYDSFLVNLKKIKVLVLWDFKLKDFEVKQKSYYPFTFNNFYQVLAVFVKLNKILN